MYTAHHSMTRHQSQQDPRRTKQEALMLALKLRGVKAELTYTGSVIRLLTMTTPEGVVVTARTIKEAWETYHNDVALHGLPIINTNNEDEEEE